MNFDAIELVSQGLRRMRWERRSPPRNITGGIYVGPLDDPDAQDAAAVLFLYRLVANADLRSAEHRVPPRSAAAGAGAPRRAAARSVLPAHRRARRRQAANCSRCACSAARCRR